MDEMDDRLNVTLVNNIIENHAQVIYNAPLINERASMKKLIPTHGGYKRLKSYQMARLVFDITVRFCNKFIDRRSRTHDQMVQAARSGVQNIVEGSQASGTSKKTEIILTNVARASFEELKSDFQDFLRQRDLVEWEYGDLKAVQLIQLRVAKADEFVRWVQKLNKDTFINIPDIAANGVLVLLRVTCSLLDRQLNSLAKTYQTEGDFNERLSKIRREIRNTTIN